MARKAQRHRPAIRAVAGAAKVVAALALVTLLALVFARSIPNQDRYGPETLAAKKPFIGAWLGSWPGPNDKVMGDFEEKTGTRLATVDLFLDWYTPVGNVTHSIRAVQEHGAVPVLTWEAHTFTTADIVAGTKKAPLRDGRHVAVSAYIDEFAEGTCKVVKETGMPIVVRPLHEMNGDWFHWGLSWKDSTGKRPNTPEMYKAAWIRIHDAFTDRCPAGTVKFVFATNHFSIGEGVGFLTGYPGDAYVDLLGIDGYNWGTNAPWGWQSFDTLFSKSYCEMHARLTQPIIVTEVASAEKGGDKAAWIRDMFDRVGSTQYAQISGLVYFDDGKYESEVRGQVDWNTDSSPAALEAFRAGAKTFVESELGARDAPAGGPRC